MTILEACQDGDLAAVHRLLTEDPSLAASTGEYDKTPLHLAAEHNHPMVAHLLLAHGAPLEAMTSWGMTPLEWAATLNSQSTAQVLVDRGAVVTLYSAAGLGMVDRVAGFLNDDGEVQPEAMHRRVVQLGDEGWTSERYTDSRLAISDAFYVACRSGHIDVARYLLERGADINYRGFFGATGLHWAAGNGHADVVSFLLANGARKDLLDLQFSSSAQGWAIEFGHEDVVALLE